MLSEKVKFCKGLAPAADRFNTSPATDIISMANADRLTFLVAHQGGTTGVGTFTVEACSDVSASATTAIPFRYRRMTTGDSDTMGAISSADAAGISSVAAEDTLIEIEVLAENLPSGKPFVRLKCTEAVNDPVNAAVIVILDKLRYSETSQPSAIA